MKFTTQLNKTTSYNVLSQFLVLTSQCIPSLINFRIFITYQKTRYSELIICVMTFETNGKHQKISAI